MNGKVAGWLSHQPDWQGARTAELGGGRSNRAWRLTTSTRSGVLKLDSEPRDWPGNSRDEEAAVQRLAADAGVAAPVYWQSAGGILTGWLEGRALDAAAFQVEALLRDIGSSLRRVHALPRSGRFFDLGRWAEHYRDLLTVAGRFDSTAREACAWLAGTRLPGPDVLSHNDLVPANIVAGDDIRFLDWEYASDNSWLFDLATLHVEGALDADATSALFEGYAGAASMPAAFVEAVTAYRFLAALWEASVLPAVS